MIPISNQFLYRQVQFSKNKKTFILFSLKIHSLSPRFNHTSNFSSHKSHHVNARHAIKSMTSYSTMPCNPPPHYHITSHSTCHKHVIKEYDTNVAPLTHIIFNIQNSTFIHNEQDLGVGLNLTNKQTDKQINKQPNGQSNYHYLNTINN